jgi:hypothetical protein
MVQAMGQGLDEGRQSVWTAAMVRDATRVVDAVVGARLPWAAVADATPGWHERRAQMGAWRVQVAGYRRGLHIRVEHGKVVRYAAAGLLVDQDEVYDDDAFVGMTRVDDVRSLLTRERPVSGGRAFPAMVILKEIMRTVNRKKKVQ